MKEEFLHYLWKNKLYDSLKLRAINDFPIVVLNSGIHNQNTGPDFLNSKIEIAHQVWFGNVEIHLKSSDWYAHRHETDENYDAVILHVVWEHDEDVYMKNNMPIPTLELKQYVDQKLLEKYNQLDQQSLRWIPCEKEINAIDSFLFNNWLERLFIERLERKSILINELLRESKNDWEYVMFCLLAKNFGLKVNGDAFLDLAKSISYSVIRKEQSSFDVLSALFFGQAGFLSESIEEPYHAHLKKEYDYLRRKYELVSYLKNSFQFFRMRPSNFPTVRIAQLAALYSKYQSVFSEVTKVKAINEFYQLFKIEVSGFWNTHYNFTKESKRNKKGFTKSFLDLLFINTIIPLQFSYQKTMNTLNEESLFEMMKAVKSEKNSIISKFSELKVTAKNAFESQALLELKNNYCASKRCLECAIGNQLLKN
ncbi:MAG: DUF2851 family protein [Flavobacteriaceae bacterium]